MTTSNITQTQSKSWTRQNIALHWTILGLLIVQFFGGEWMADLFDKSFAGESIDRLTYFFGYTHMAVGGLVFLAIAVRLWDRFAHGRPAHDSNEPGWATVLGKVTHVGIYAILLGMPVASLLA